MELKQFQTGKNEVSFKVPVSRLKKSIVMCLFDEQGNLPNFKNYWELTYGGESPPHFPFGAWADEGVVKFGPLISAYVPDSLLKDADVQVELKLKGDVSVPVTPKLFFGR